MLPHKAKTIEVNLSSNGSIRAAKPVLSDVEVQRTHHERTRIIHVKNWI